jgi:glutathione peroxidase
LGPVNRVSRFVVFAVCLVIAGMAGSSAAQAPPASFYDLTLADLEGRSIDMAAYRGQVVLVVNVASFCGYTAQYGGLEKLHREFAPRGFAVLGFPSNEFGAQEPGTPAEIRKFVTEKFGVTFPLFAKSQVRPGKDQSPAFAFLGKSGKVPQWNFGKYLVGKDGQVLDLFSSDVTPESATFRGAIDKALGAPIPAGGSR